MLNTVFDEICYPEPYDCPSCDEKEKRLEVAAYWLQSIVQRLEHGQPDDIEIDLEELCYTLGVTPPKAKICYA